MVIMMRRPDQLWRWSTSGVLVVVVVVAALTSVGGQGHSKEYVPDSILCDDVAAICVHNGLSYDERNETVCGNRSNFLSPEVCNCGTTCLTELGEGQPCLKSTPLQFPQEACGPGLHCLSHDPNRPDKAVCTRNAALPCISQTIEYEQQQQAGTLGPGAMQPQCDQYGQFAPTQCSPGTTCYCVDDEGTRLFGEGFITEKGTMNCKCAIYWQKAARGVSEGLRCLPNGNFDPLQCLGDYCVCLDDRDFTVTEGPLPRVMFREMQCYNPEMHSPQYTNPCHTAQQLWDSQLDNNTVLIAENSRPLCSPDGYYAPTRRIGPLMHCVDIYGYPIENFTLPLHEAADMHCNCARRRYLMEQNGLSASKPKCEADGSFTPQQTRGLFAFCIDQNGNQIGETVAVTDLESLSC